jgi:hypothetical protein
MGCESRAMTVDPIPRLALPLKASQRDGRLDRHGVPGWFAPTQTRARSLFTALQTAALGPRAPTIECPEWPTSDFMQRQVATRCRRSSAKDLSLGVLDWSSKQTYISERAGQSRLTLSDYDTLARRRPSPRQPAAVRWAARHTAVHLWTTIRRGPLIEGCVASEKCAAHAPRFGSEQSCCG